MAEHEVDFLASDAFFKWKGMVKNAEESVVVFTPFFNHTLLTLLGNAQSSALSLTVITNFSPEVLLQAPQQLRAIKSLLRAGVDVRHIDGLHAKTLWVDGQVVATGSQNFTANGRRAKECTVFSCDHKSSKFLSELRAWIDESTRVDEGLVDYILSCVDQAARKYRALLREFDEDFHFLTEDYINSLKRERISRMRTVEASSPYRPADGVLHAWLEEKEFEYEYARTLVADGDMTRWLKVDAGVQRLVEFDRLVMRPVLLAQSGRMAFARVGKERITYVRYSVQRVDKFVPYRDRFFKIDVSFPKKDLEQRNVIINLTCSGCAELELQILFFPGVAKLFSTKISGFRSNIAGPRSDFEHWIDERFGTQSALMNLLALSLSPFQYKHLRLDDKNAEDFFGTDLYQLSLLNWEGFPLIVANL